MTCSIQKQIFKVPEVKFFRKLGTSHDEQLSHCQGKVFGMFTTRARSPTGRHSGDFVSVSMVLPYVHILQQFLKFKKSCLTKFLSVSTSSLVDFVMNYEAETLCIDTVPL